MEMKKSIFKPRTIQQRLLLNFIIIALLSTLGVSIGSIFVNYQNARSDSIDHLDAIATAKQAEISNWLQSLQNELVVVANQGRSSEQAGVILQLNEEDKFYEFYFSALRKRLIRNVSQSPNFKEILLVDLQGNIVLSTKDFHEAASIPPEYFQESSPASLVRETGFQEDGSAVLFVHVPVFSLDNHHLGHLVGISDAEGIQKVMDDRSSLGNTGRIYFVGNDRKMVLVSSPGSEEVIGEVSSSGLDRAINFQENISGFFQDYKGVAVAGIYRRIPDLNLLMVIEQDLREVFSVVFTTLLINLIIVVLIILLAIIAAIGLTRKITSPIITLAHTATEIAVGHLDREVRIESRDEIGVLADSFSSMTQQIRDLINSLERRVEERTIELQNANAALKQHTKQLEASAGVSREVTSILDLEELLSRVAMLISQAFGYYSVQIFIVNPDLNQLILSASSVGIGQLLMKNKLCLNIDGKNLNSKAVLGKMAVVANDVAQEKSFLYYELLKNTRSELVVPLRVVDTIVGTLDVHSDCPHAFSKDDQLILQSLGDQIAIAIENARLYEQSQQFAVLQERNRLARDLHDSITQSLFSIDLHAKAIDTYLDEDLKKAKQKNENLRSITQNALAEMRTLISNLRPVTLEDKGLEAVLKEHIQLIRRSEGPDLIFRFKGNKRLPLEIERELFRIAQEALRNADKHSGATEIIVHCCVSDSNVRLTIRDNGKGFDKDSLPDDRQAFGLISMQQRASIINARLDIESRPNMGCTVNVLLEIPKIGERNGENPDTNRG